MMAPLKLNGLNVVQPVQQDNQDLASPFPDFSAHLDLWTNLAFESDEPLKRKPDHGDDDDDDDDDDGDNPDSGLPHKVTNTHPVLHPAPPDAPALDINALLAGFGIDPFLMPNAAPAQRNAPPHINPVPSLSQLLALHAVQAASLPAPSPPSASTPPSPAAASSPNPPSPKRTRTQKPSSFTEKITDSFPTTLEELPQSPQSEQAVTTQSAAEDKRRRNTAASARFRLKKKEREAALERRAKELEDRVVELERECEGLRRENGWLKGLVVGVTGAGAAQHQLGSTK